MKVSKRIADLAIDACLSGRADEEQLGFCLACGEETSPVEPDARHYQCEGCERRAVYGAEEILIMVVP